MKKELGKFLILCACSNACNSMIVTVCRGVISCHELRLKRTMNMLSLRHREVTHLRYLWERDYIPVIGQKLKGAGVFPAEVLTGG